MNEPATRGTIAAHVAANLSTSSFIRAMFEKGRALREIHGAHSVFDFSLGNPDASPPPAVFDAIRAVAGEANPGLHRYMPNAGFDETRAAIAAMLTQEYGAPFSAGDVVVTCGAAGGLNVAMRAICDPGDEVIVLAPYFVEYRAYIEQAGARMVVVNTGPGFEPDVAAIMSAVTPRTRAILVNSPNNPTGAVYSADSIAALCEAAARVDAPQRPLYIVCDDPYRRLVFEGGKPAHPIERYVRTIIASSYSKDLSLPGERIGYLAPSPRMQDRAMLLNAFIMLNRTLGYVNAPAFMQRVIARCATALCDINHYRVRRDALAGVLRAAGYEFDLPRGGMFLFPKTPIADDVAFCDRLLQQRILAVPGSGFGGPGFMRLSLAVSLDAIERSGPGFAAARQG